MDDKHWAECKVRSGRVRNILQGRVSNRVAIFMARQYLWAKIEKPLEDLTDAQLLDLEGLGPKTLAEIREVIPAPKK